MAEQVLVLGVGNILFSDEAIGVRTVEHLQQCASLPGNVELMDGGTLGIRLMDAIMGCDLLIVVDAVLGGGEPGTLYRLEGEGLRESMSFRDSMHQTDLVDTLIYCDLAGHRPDAVVIGMEPSRLPHDGDRADPGLSGAFARSGREGRRGAARTRGYRVVSG